MYEQNPQPPSWGFCSFGKELLPPHIYTGQQRFPALLLRQRTDDIAPLLSLTISFGVLITMQNPFPIRRKSKSCQCNVWCILIQQLFNFRKYEIIPFIFPTPKKTTPPWYASLVNY